MLNYESLDSTKFERLCKIILRSLDPNLKTIDGKGGDEGSDSFLGTINKQSTVFQFKFFKGRMDPSKWRQIKKSLNTSMEKTRPKIWHLLIPIEFTREEHIKWENLQKEYPQITFKLWTKVDLEVEILQRKDLFIDTFSELFSTHDIAKHIARIMQNESFKINNNESFYFSEDSLFVGREFEIHQIKSIIKSKSIVSIIGIGGIGKTQLSFKFMNTHKNKFNIVIPIYMENGLSFDNFLLSIVNALGKAFDSKNQEEKLRNILSYINNIPNLLLYIDNFEIISNDPNKTENSNIIKFLKSLPNTCKILLTSRNRINIDGEYRYEIKGLNPFDSCRLFINCARNNIPSKVSEIFIEKINELCIKIEGHPLMIRLLGKSYTGFGISEIMDMMDKIYGSEDRLESLRRFQNIEKCFDYTFNKMGKDKKKALLKLMLFKSPFSMNAIQNIFEKPKDFTSVINGEFIQKYDISKYIRTERLFYYFHPLVRDYLNKKTEIESLNAYLPRYCKYFANIIENYNQIGLHDEIFNPHLLSQILKHYPNDFTFAIEHIGEPRSQSILLNKMGLILGNLRFVDDSLIFHKKCLEMDIYLNDKERIANDYFNLANCYSSSDYNKSFEYYTKSLSLYKELNETKYISRINLNLANLNLIHNKMDISTKYFETALKIIKITPNNKYLLYLYFSGIVVYFFKKGNYLKVLGYSMAAFTLKQKISEERGIFF